MTNEKPGARPAVKTFQTLKLFGFFVRVCVSSQVVG